MKNIKDYVCTFGQAKKLEKLGIEQDSLYYYDEDGEIISEYHITISDIIKYSAFTSQEFHELIRKKQDEISYYPSFRKEIELAISYNEAINRACFLIHVLETEKEMEKRIAINTDRQIEDLRQELLKKYHDNTKYACPNCCSLVDELITCQIRSIARDKNHARTIVV